MCYGTVHVFGAGRDAASLVGRPQLCAMSKTVICAALIVASLVVTVDLRAAGRTIRVYDTSDATEDVRATAIRTAREILAKTGIAVDWRDCTSTSLEPPCQDAKPGDLIIRIMPEATPSASFRGSALQMRSLPGESLQLGVAIINPVTLSGEMATIFQEPVRAIARHTGMDDAELLGRAVAHEVGHLLLRAREHSPSGIMRGAWSREELSTNRPEDWQFSPADRERLRQNHLP